MLTYVLINCPPGSETKIIAELKKIPEVKEVNGIMGRYDIFAKLFSKTPTQMDAAILKIRDTNGINASYSMPVLYGQGGTVLDEETGY